MDETTQVVRQLDDVAYWAADRLDAGDDAAVWAVTKTLEEAAGMASEGKRPVSPLLARRFARVHGVLVGRAEAPVHEPASITMVEVVAERVLCGV